ncbi:MAG TPA: polysaccharide pyruvyl transferase family protein [Fimbriimonadaceae bacterium]|nr:polysaccharide pyruvyl transferase family protein [Fimbriimonadaceae bacterium]
MAAILLAGYFGSGNLGDDAILQGYVLGMREAGMDEEFHVLSGSSESIQRNYGLISWDRKNMRQVAEAISKCDLLVFPGGSIFQDATSTRSVAYYRELVVRAKKAGKKVLLLGQGVGPLTSFFGKRMAVEAFKAADAIAVRDPGSLTTLKSLGVNRPIQVTADSAFLLPPPPENPGEVYAVAGMRSIGIAPRPFGKTKETVTLFSDLCGLIFRAHMVPVLIEMDRFEDGDLIDLIEKKSGGRISHIRKLDVASTAQTRLARMDGVIAMRLHAAILAATVGVPPLIVNYDPKTLAFAKLLGLPIPPAIEGLTAQRLFEMFMEHQKATERNRQIVLRSVKELTDLAVGNLELTKKFLRGAATIKG